VASGWATYNDVGGDWLEDLHEGAANALLALVVVHVLGVVVSSRLHHENLVRSMVTGHKFGRPEDAIRSAWRSVAALMVVAVLGFWSWQWTQAPRRRLRIDHAHPARRRRPLLGDGLRAGLRQLGFQVDWVRDGEAAERELRAEPYAAAVLDLGLPRLDGLDVLAACAGRVTAGAGADRARRRARPHPRPGPGRRRLRRQAGRPARAGGPAARAGAPRPRPAAGVPAGRRTWCWTRRRACSCAGEPVALSPREFDLLHALMLATPAAC
jgi:hypothetical protein